MIISMITEILLLRALISPPVLTICIAAALTLLYERRNEISSPGFPLLMVCPSEIVPFVLVSLSTTDESCGFVQSDFGDTYHAIPFGPFFIPHLFLVGVCPLCNQNSLFVDWTEYDLRLESAFI